MKPLEKTVTRKLVPQKAFIKPLEAPQGSVKIKI